MTLRRFSPALLLAVVSFMVTSTARADKTQLDPGEEALPYRIPVLNADRAKQSTFALEDVVGPDATTKKKFVLMSFFATYCEPCKRELPYLAALNTEYGDRGLQVVSVSIDKEEEKIKEAQGLVEQHNLTHPVLKDRFQVVAKRYYVTKLPCLYMINSDMKVAKVSIGYDDNASREILAEVRKGLGIPESDPVPPSLAKFLGKAPPSQAAQPTGEDEDTGKKGKGKKVKGSKGKKAKAG
jgi:alkyl hydroperoxide reductase subunit AhpC